MSALPNHREFRNHIERVTIGLEKGIYEGVYNHQDSCHCVVGLALEDYVGQPIDAGQTGELLSSISDARLHSLFNTFGMRTMNDMRDQKQGAIKAREYLAATRELETVE